MAKENERAEKKISTESEPKFKLKKLQKNCRKLFGISESIFIGAATGLAEGEYSVSEIKTIIEKWYKKEAK